MKNANEKRGLFERLTGIKKGKKSSCCCNFKIEEIPPDPANSKPNDQSNVKDKSCCKK